MHFSRIFAMPNKDTFSCLPIGNFVQKYLKESEVSVDPFARNKDWCSWTNDLNPDTSATYHMDAEEFLLYLDKLAVRVNLGIIDPPYSPRQISECYKGFGKEVGKEETQSARLYRRVKDAMNYIIPVGGKVLSFGWNSSGMGKGRGYEIEEILLVNHGAGHNDTICVAERKVEDK